MPRYKCHKEVWALKIKQINRMQEANVPSDCESDGLGGGAQIVPEEVGYAPFIVGPEYLRKHRPQIGGYYVVYADGYQSYSPAKAFEEGYAPIN